MSGPHATPGRGLNLKALYGDNCFYSDSSWKRMHRDPSDIKVFNFFGGGGCGCSCGCGFGWGGFGMGLLGGFLNGLNNFMYMGYNMFFGNMFGNMFGGFPSMNIFGGNNNTTTTKNNTTKTVYVETTNVVGNKDTDKQSELTTRIDVLEQKAISEKKIPTTELQTIIDEIDDIINNDNYADDIQNDKDEIIYRGLIKRLQLLKLGKINNDDGTITNIGDGIYIIINGKNIKTVQDVNNISEDKFNAINQQTAQTILLTLGYISEDTNSTRPGMTDRTSTNRLVGKMSNNYRILKLLEKSGVAVEVEFNSTDKVKDHWISGPITNVTKDADGKLSYHIDCSKTGKAIKGEYDFVSENNENTKFTATPTTNRGKNAKTSYQFKYQSEQEPLLNDEVVYINE